MTTFKPSPAQQAFYDWVENDHGNCVLTAVAGAGKTTTILNGIARMKGKVWFGVYNKKMADEIRDKLQARNDLRERLAFQSRDRVESSTFHSLGFSIFRSSTGRKNVKVDTRKCKIIAESLIEEREAVQQMPRDDLRAMLPGVLGMVSLAKNRGFVPERSAKMHGLTSLKDFDAWWNMLTHFDLLEAIPEGEEQKAIGFAIRIIQRSLQDLDTIDMDDMIFMPLALNMRLAPWHRFDWVLIDEAQDTNPTRRALARYVMAPGARLVAVGDPHQAIFGFTGADNDSLEQIRDAFQAKELPLTITYRCPKAVVAHAQQWVSHIEAHESAPEGEVCKGLMDDMIEEIKALDADDYAETSILCRYNKYLVSTCFSLIRAGVPAKIEGREVAENLVKLATKWKVKTVNGLETRLRAYEEREVAKALAKEQEQRADRIADEVATLLTIMDRVREKGLDRVEDVVDEIESIFEDQVSGKGLVTLCSAHKSKGLEWDRVYLLNREALMPSKFARQDWQLDQERNLIYVAVTRAKKTLIEVEGAIE